MSTFIIEGKKIEAKNEQEAIAKYVSKLVVTKEEEEKYQEPLRSINLPDWIKDGIFSEGDQDKLKYPHCIISTTDDAEVSVRGFKTTEQFEKAVEEIFENPDGSNWQLSYVVSGGKVFTVKAKVEIKYIPYKG